MGNVRKLQYDDRQSWLEGKLDRIGSGDAAGVLGKHPYRSPYRIWTEKTRRLLPEERHDERLEWGIRHEQAIAQAVLDRTGREVVLTDDFVTYLDAEHDWLGASPDGLIRPREPFQIGATAIEAKQPGAFEIKTSDFFAARRNWRRQIGERWIWQPPVYDEIQLQHEMRVAGVRWGSIVCLVGGNQLIGPFDYVFDYEAFVQRLPVYRQFWECVLDGRPPEIDDSESTAEALKQMHKERDAGSVVDLRNDLLPAFFEWRTAAARESKAKKEKEAARNKLIAALGPAEIGRFPDGREVTYFEVKNPGYTVDPYRYRVLRASNGE